MLQLFKSSAKAHPFKWLIQFKRISKEQNIFVVSFYNKKTLMLTF